MKKILNLFKIIIFGDSKHDCPEPYYEEPPVFKKKKPKANIRKPKKVPRGTRLKSKTRR